MKLVFFFFFFEEVDCFKVDSHILNLQDLESPHRLEKEFEREDAASLVLNEIVKYGFALDGPVGLGLVEGSRPFVDPQDHLHDDCHLVRGLEEFLGCGIGV